MTPGDAEGHFDWEPDWRGRWAAAAVGPAPCARPLAPGAPRGGLREARAAPVKAGSKDAGNNL